MIVRSSKSFLFKHREMMVVGETPLTSSLATPGHDRSHQLSSSETHLPKLWGAQRPKRRRAILSYRVRSEGLFRPSPGLPQNRLSLSFRNKTHQQDLRSSIFGLGGVCLGVWSHHGMQENILGLHKVFREWGREGMGRRELGSLKRNTNTGI